MFFKFAVRWSRTTGEDVGVHVSRSHKSRDADCDLQRSYADVVCANGRTRLVRSALVQCTL